MVLLGALIQTGTVPLQIENVKEAIMNKTSKTFVGSNLKAFELGVSVAKELG
jgi:indolepyruvate ferredoxin oxidoreductase beta subunit